MYEREPISVAVLIVSYNGRSDLEQCLASVMSSEDAGLHCRVVVVDNASIDGTPEAVQQWPRVELIRASANLGFAGGNNLGWDHIAERYPDTRYLCLLNQDTIVRTGWLSSLANYLERNPQAAIAQAKLLLHPQTHLINTAGNRSHFLGFGYMTGYGEPDDGRYDQARSIDYASGAALMVRTDLLRQVGLFDDAMFMHLEDAELAWKARQIGYEVAFVPDAVVHHKYVPDAPLRHYRHLERNRWLLLLTYYKWPTLLLLSPALLLMECGQWLFAARHGLLLHRLGVYLDLLAPSGLARLFRRRREAQDRRGISDHRFTTGFSGTIIFSALQSPILRYLGNPILNAYWQVASRIIRW